MLIYTKVIIEVKNLQNNDLIGKVVLSRAGRDENHLYVVIGQLDKDYVLIANGNNKTVKMPRERKLNI